MSRSPTLFSSDEEEEGPESEELLLRKFQTMLQGVPPPSSITMSKLNASDMLLKYKENEPSFGLDDLCPQKRHKNKHSTPLVYYFNSSKVSEEIAILSQKVLSRYVYSETMSSCNIWFESSTTTSSAKKSLSRRSRVGFSPGSRLSHLARRRQIFSSENLQKLANLERRHHIEIEKQNSSRSSRSFVRNSVAECDKGNSFKRALFLSPDDDDENQRKLGTSSQPNLVSSSNRSIINDSGSGRTVWLSQRDINTSSSKKRKRLDSKERNGNWPRRALTFSEKDLGKNQDANAANTKVISEIQLSLHHKTKLLWAVSAALKEKNINSNNSQFKSCASALFMICRKNLSKILNSKVEGGTSDKILHFARGHVDGILKKLCLVQQAMPRAQAQAQTPVPTESGNLVREPVPVKSSQSLSQVNSECSTVLPNKPPSAESEPDHRVSGTGQSTTGSNFGPVGLGNATAPENAAVAVPCNEKENINTANDTYNVIIS